MNTRIAQDENGQSALFDAILFLVIMIIASCLVSVYASQYSKNTDLIARENMMNYARDTSETVFGATLNFTWYEDIQGNVITKPPGNTKVMNLILEELYLLDSGLPRVNFALGYEQDIKILLRNLIVPNYHFALKGIYTSGSSNRSSLVFISDIVPDYISREEAKQDTNDYSQLVPKNNLASIRHTQPGIGSNGDAIIHFLLWR
jgi:hypothetical protein